MRGLVTAGAALALAGLLAVPACFAPSYGDGTLACDQMSRCPSGFRCYFGHCYSEGKPPPAPEPDAAVPVDMSQPPEAEDMNMGVEGSTPDVAETNLLKSLEVAGGDTKVMGSFDPAFDSGTLAYTVNLPLSAQFVTVKATPGRPDTQMSVQGSPLLPGVESAPLPLSREIFTLLSVEATASDGTIERYSLILVRGGLTTYVKASNVGKDDHFGRSVALSADTLVVGTPDEASSATGINGDQLDNSAPASGAVYVFVRTNGHWTQQAFIKPMNTTAGMKFGASVAIAGDTLAVGAPEESGSATGINGAPDQAAKASGAAYVFVRVNGTWSQQAYVKPQITTMLDNFGTSVAVSGNTLAVGAIGESGTTTGVNGDQKKKGAMFAGAVYVFLRTGTTWAQQAYVKASVTKAENEFGASVALSGDTLVVGAPKEDGGGTGTSPSPSAPAAIDSGAAYVFTRSGTTWSQQTTLKPSNTAPGFTFGTRVDVMGDLAAVGAPLEGSASRGIDGDQKQSKTTAGASGAVYLFRRVNGEWSQIRYIKASNTAAGDHFGETLALSTDALVVGAPGEDSASRGPGGSQDDNGKLNSGAVYLFSISGTIVTQTAYLKAPNADKNEAFGGAVTVSGSTIAVGAEAEGGTTSGIDGSQRSKAENMSGAVYIEF